MQSRIGAWVRSGDLAIKAFHEGSRKASFHFYSDIPKLFNHINIEIHDAFIFPDPLQHAADVKNNRFNIKHASRYIDIVYRIEIEFTFTSSIPKDELTAITDDIFKDYEVIYKTAKEQFDLNSIKIIIANDLLPRFYNDFANYRTHFKNQYKTLAYQFDNTLLKIINEIIKITALKYNSITENRDEQIICQSDFWGTCTFQFRNNFKEFHSNKKWENACHFIPELEHVLKELGRNKKSVDGEGLMNLVNTLNKKYPNISTNENKDLFLKSHKFLVNGQDPNTFYDHTSYFGNILQATRDRRLIQLWLAYGAQFFIPCTNFKDSPIDFTLILSAYDIALMGKNNTALDVFVSANTKLTKSLTTINLVSIDTLADEDRLLSIFRFSNSDFLFTQFKKSENITTKEKQHLFNIYKKLFATNNNQAFDSIFESESDKFIKLIYNSRNKIIGAVVYRIKNVNNELWVNIDFEMIDPSYPNYGMMPTITYSVPFSLQQLFPDTNIWIVFFAAHYNSFRRIENQFTATPKYQPEGKIEQVISILREAFNFKFTAKFESPSLCYLVEENSVCVNGKPQPSSSFMEDLYRIFRGDDGEIPYDEICKRDVLVSLPVGFELLQTLHQIAASKQTNFYNYVCDFALKLRASHLFDSIVHNISDIKRMSYPNSSLLFWDGDRQQVNSSEYNEFDKPESKHQLNARM